MHAQVITYKHYVVNINAIATAIVQLYLEYVAIANATLLL